jgi:hypothetical protein
MPKKRRQAHIPQQSNRKRRVTRRPEFAPAPQPQERNDLDGQPIFADSVAMPAGNLGSGGGGGPVETRPHWIGGTAPQRQPGRRTAQLRRGAAAATPSRAAAGPLPSFERAFLVSELRRITLISAALFGVIIVLTLVLR